MTIKLLTCAPSFLVEGKNFHGVTIAAVINSCDHDLLPAAPILRINGTTTMPITGHLHVLHTETKENLNMYPVEVQGSAKR